MTKINIQTTRTAMPRCYCYSTPTVLDHVGWVKIGYTEQDDVEYRIRQQLQHISRIILSGATLLFLPTAKRISVTAIFMPISKNRVSSV